MSASATPRHAAQQREKDTNAQRKHKRSLKLSSEPTGQTPAPAKEYLVTPESSTPEALCQAQNTHYALHTLAPNPHANPQARGPPTITPRLQPSSHPDHYVCFCHSWCMNPIGHEDTYQVIQNLQYLS